MNGWVILLVWYLIGILPLVILCVVTKKVTLHDVFLIPIAGILGIFVWYIVLEELGKHPEVKELVVWGRKK